VIRAAKAADPTVVVKIEPLAKRIRVTRLPVANGEGAQSGSTATPDEALKAWQEKHASDAEGAK
jgi:hypothetical protein